MKDDPAVHQPECLKPSGGPKRPYYLPIDGIRAICVFLVMLYHLKTETFLPFVHGYLGVDVFFVISGFLITDLLLIEERDNKHIDLAAFYLRRIFRILPIYFVVLLLYILICHLPSQAAKWTQLKAGLPYFLLFLNEFAKEPSPGTVFIHSWSLGIEEKYYLIWPVAFFFLAKTRQIRMVIVAALFILTFMLPFVLARAYQGLLGGCVMAIVMTGGMAAGYARSLRRFPVWAALAVLLLGFVLEYWDHKFIFAFSWLIALFLSYLIVKPTWMSKMLSARPMVWLGKRSYSMYLIHVLALNLFERFVQLSSFVRSFIVLLAAYSLTALGAHILHTTVEEPARIFGKGFISQRRLRYDRTAK
jgi:peptidoglycan/LPS O-acetylase OafA/YrhL